MARGMPHTPLLCLGYRADVLLQQADEVRAVHVVGWSLRALQRSGSRVSQGEWKVVG